LEATTDALRGDVAALQREIAASKAQAARKRTIADKQLRAAQSAAEAQAAQLQSEVRAGG